MVFGLLSGNGRTMSTVQLLLPPIMSPVSVGVSDLSPVFSLPLWLQLLAILGPVSESRSTVAPTMTLFLTGCPVDEQLDSKRDDEEDKSDGSPGKMDCAPCDGLAGSRQACRIYVRNEKRDLLLFSIEKDEVRKESMTV